MYIVIKNTITNECEIIGKDEHYDETYRKVFGPASLTACRKWIELNC